MSHFEENVMKLLGEMNQQQKAFQESITNELKEVKDLTRIIKGEVGSLREDFHTIQENVDVVEVEQNYQLTKWLEHDRRISKLERKIMS